MLVLGGCLLLLVYLFVFLEEKEHEVRLGGESGSRVGLENIIKI